jgi:hypothetical protein
MSREQQKGPARGAGWDMGEDRARRPARGVRARKAWRKGACRPESISAMMQMGEGAAKAVVVKSVPASRRSMLDMSGRELRDYCL